MNCHESQKLLQRRLDGEEMPLTVEWEQHLIGCPSCHSNYRAAGRLLQGVGESSIPELPANFALKMTSLILRDRAQRHATLRRRMWVTVGMAAAILLVASTGRFWLPAPRPAIQQPGPLVQERPPEPLAKNFDDARDALASLTQRITEPTEQAGKWLIEAMPEIPQPEPSEILSLAAAQSLADTGSGMAEGITTVTRNARRAFDFFVREMPTFDASTNQ